MKVFVALICAEHTAYACAHRAISVEGHCCLLRGLALQVGKERALIIAR